jgi:hypothetical protein
VLLVYHTWPDCAKGHHCAASYLHPQYVQIIL